MEVDWKELLMFVQSLSAMEKCMQSVHDGQAACKSSQAERDKRHPSIHFEPRSGFQNTHILGINMITNECVAGQINCTVQPRTFGQVSSRTSAAVRHEFATPTFRK